MFRDEFKERYTTIPLAIYRACCRGGVKKIITHQHRELEIIYLTEGEATFYIGFESYDMKKGDILIIPPYALHRGRTSETKPTAYYCICFDVNLLCDRQLVSGLEAQAIVGKNLITGNSELQDYIENAYLACEREETGWEMVAVGNMSLLFGILKNNGFFSKNTGTDKNASFGKEVMEYIINHYSEAISSHDAALALYIDHSSFCRSFKKTFGICFTDYVLAYRIEKARVYLKNTDFPVTEIAFKVGFNDCSYFCKVFKKIAGMSPLVYRKTNEG